MAIKVPNKDIRVERQLGDADTTLIELETAQTIDGVPIGGSGGGSGTVTSVDATGGVETLTGTPITASGTIRGAELVNAQTGTTYTYLTGDRGKLVTHTNGSAIAGTLPQAGTNFPSGWWMDVQNRGAGTLTITPTTSTIDGAASLALRTGEGVRIVSDGTNYFTQRGISNDVNAIHSNVAGEINGITEKTTLALADLVVIEDSAASNAKKKAKIQNVRPQLSYMWQSESPAVTGVHNRFYVDRAGTITEVRPNVVKGDGTSTMNLDVLKNGTSIYPSATKPNVAAAGFTNGSFAPDTTSFSDGDYFTINVTATGGTTGPIRLIIKFKEA